MRILIVEDDARIRQSLADDLRRQHHAVDIAADGLLGLDFALTNVHDVILLDVVLPGLDGVEVCRRLRADNSSAMILMITARDETTYKVGALDGGADDYLVKPFDLAEVSARIRALSRRQRAVRPAILQHGDLVLDPSCNSVTWANRPVALTPAEYAILETLMRSPLQIFSRSLLRNKVTTFDDGSGHDSIKTHITNIRRKIRNCGANADPIENVYGTGYRLADANG